MLTPTLILFVLLAGVGFGLMTIAYRLGQERGVPTQAIVFVIGLAGTAYCVASTWPVPFWHAPWQTWGGGIAIGFSQYLLTLLIAAALRRKASLSTELRLVPRLCSYHPHGTTALE